MNPWVGVLTSMIRRGVVSEATLDGAQAWGRIDGDEHAALLKALHEHETAAD